MALLRIKPTHLDRHVAEFVSAVTNPDFEYAARLLTWGADGLQCELCSKFERVLRRSFNVPVSREALYT